MMGTRQESRQIVGTRPLRGCFSGGPDSNADRLSGFAAAERGSGQDRLPADEYSEISAPRGGSRHGPGHTGGISLSETSRDGDPAIPPAKMARFRRAEHRRPVQFGVGIRSLQGGRGRSPDRNPDKLSGFVALLSGVADMTSFTESVVEQAALAWLESMGCSVSHGAGAPGRRRRGRRPRRPAASWHRRPPRPTCAPGYRRRSSIPPRASPPAGPSPGSDRRRPGRSGRTRPPSGRPPPAGCRPATSCSGFCGVHSA